MPGIDVSVVVCTRNQRSELLRTLQVLAKQKSAFAWEVVVVDNGSEDGTADVIPELVARGYPVRLSAATEPTPGLSHARNRGIEVACGAVLLFIDDDVSCGPGWLDAHMRAYAEAAVVGTAGAVHPLIPDDSPPWLVEYVEYVQGGPTARYEYGDLCRLILPDGEIPLPFGCNMGVRRASVLELGGFRTDLGWGPPMIPGEETAVFRELQARGGRLLYCGGADVVHRIKRERMDPESYLRWYRGMGRSHVRLAPPHFGGTWIRETGGDLVRMLRHSIAGWGVPATSQEGLRIRIKRERAIGRVVERLWPGSGS